MEKLHENWREKYKRYLRVIDFMLFMSSFKIVRNLRVILDEKNCDFINNFRESQEMIQAVQSKDR